jgi:hypothetical protein
VWDTWQAKGSVALALASTAFIGHALYSLRYDPASIGAYIANAVEAGCGLVGLGFVRALWNDAKAEAVQAAIPGFTLEQLAERVAKADSESGIPRKVMARIADLVKRNAYQPEVPET